MYFIYLGWLETVPNTHASVFLYEVRELNDELSARKRRKIPKHEKAMSKRGKATNFGENERLLKIA